MNIKHPELLFLLILIPLGIAFLYTVWKRRQDLLKLLAKPSRIKTLFPNSSSFKSLLRFVLLASTLTALVTALISPRWGYDWKEIETQGTNIIVALDLSKSMLAEDINPSRLARAKFEIVKLIEKLSGDRIGLIIFAGDAFLQSPLTHDYLMVREWVSKLTVDSVETPGTSFKLALQKARKAFKYVKSEGKALIIMSDGEEQDEAALEEAKGAKSEGIRIYTIGIGTAKGAPIQYKGALVRDSAGEVVISKLDDSFLKEIAEAASGEYLRSSGSDFHLDKLYYDHIKAQLADELVKSGRTKKWRETYQFFVAIAFVCLLLELILGLNLGLYNSVKSWFGSRIDSSFERLRRNKKSGLFVFLLFFLFAAPASATNALDPRLWQADTALKADSFNDARTQYLKLQVENPHNPRLNYNLGIAHYRQGLYDQALTSFARSAKLAENEILKESALYNLGNANFKIEDYKAAVDAYEAALAIDPNDEDAKHNLELAKEKLDEQEEDQDKDGEGEDEQDQNQQQQQQDQQNQNQDQQNQDQQQQQKQKQQQQQNDLSQQDIENLLRQVHEAKPGEVDQDQDQGAGGPRSDLNPW